MNATIDDRELRRFQSVVLRTAGIHLSAQKRALLMNRLWRRLRDLNLDRYGDYLDRVEHDPEELVQMLDCIATNETRFFREQKQFEFLENVVAARWRRVAEEGRRQCAVSVWSAACSTGEEPYSVAMCLRAALGPLWDVRILATDLSTRALGAARAGVWPAEKAAHIPPRFLSAFMLRGRGSQLGKIKAAPEIRAMISFARLNLNDAEYGTRQHFDLILCRNVLMYFDGASRQRVVERLADRLAPDGVLFVGHAETLHGMTARLRPLQPTMYERAG